MSGSVSRTNPASRASNHPIGPPDAGLAPNRRSGNGSLPVVLVNLGTTSAPEPGAVRAFLSEFLSDPMVVDYPRWLWKPILKRILATRPERVAAQYRAIWTDEGAPLLAGSRRVAAKLGAVLGREVVFAFRYGEPGVSRTLARFERSVVIPLFPQRTGSTTGTIEKLVGNGTAARVAHIGPAAAGYIQAQADLWRRSLNERPCEHVVVSFHGIPARYNRAEGGLYRNDCEATFEALLRRTGWPEGKSTLAFQSRFGPEPWLGPSTAKTLEGLARAGARSVAVVTPGFTTEGLETIEEIGIRGRKTFLEAGGERFVRVPCVEDHDAFVHELAAIVFECEEEKEHEP